MPCVSYGDDHETRELKARKVRAKLKRLGIIPGSNKEAELWFRWMRQ